MFSYHNATSSSDIPVAESYADSWWGETSYLQKEFLFNNQVSPQDVYNNQETFFNSHGNTPNPTSITPDIHVNIPILSSCIFPEIPNDIIEYSQRPPVLDAKFFVPEEHISTHYVKSRKHRAQILLTPSASGNFKAIIKRNKRKRTTFTTEQIAALEQYFSTRPYITRAQRQVLAEDLQLSDKSIKIWFQNRRLKGKRRKSEESVEETVGSDLSGDDHIIQESKLNHVQSKIMENTDAFGFVTLDDGVMRDLVDLIYDDCKVASEQPKESQISPGYYEPISPASDSGDSNEEANLTTWGPSEPNESLQRLFDLQTMLSL